jgi:hypothetical protein
MSSEHFLEHKNSRSLLVRRQFLAKLGMFAGAVALGIPDDAEAFHWPWSKDVAECGVDVGRLDCRWLARNQKMLRDYANYIEGLHLRNITVQQVVEAHAKRRGSVWNELPPKSDWRNIRHTLEVVDRVSRELDVPVTEIVSVYRTPAYNRRCPGAKRHSWHMRNFAVDVKMGTRPSRVAAMARKLRGRGEFRGGVGRYWNFTHIDTRGNNVDW